jgi:putative YhbY family RNA-binding protein
VSDLSWRRRRALRVKASSNPPVQVGKSGVTAEVVEEVRRRLDRMETVKVRVLRLGLTDETCRAISQWVASETGSSVVEVRGHTFVLHKPKARK